MLPNATEDCDGEEVGDLWTTFICNLLCDKGPFSGKDLSPMVGKLGKQAISITLITTYPCCLSIFLVMYVSYIMRKGLYEATWVRRD